LFVNPNILAEITAVVFVALVYESNWLAVGLLPTLALADCRSALLAIFVCLAFMGWQRWRWKVLYGLPAVALGASLTAYKWPTTDGTYRLDMYRDTWAGLSAWGNGIGSFYSTYPKYATHLDQLYQPFHAHNDLLELAFELGVIPASLALLLLLALFIYAGPKDRLLLTALGIISMVGFPLHVPSTVFVFGIVAGSAARSWASLRGLKSSSGRGLHQSGQRPYNAWARAGR
jgi:O-antigen ligase